MTEHERVIQHFSECCDIAEENGNGWVFVRTDVLYEALDLLKAQEPHVIKKSAGHGICPGCGHLIPAWSSPNYCGFCGQAVKWDG